MTTRHVLALLGSIAALSACDGPPPNACGGVEILEGAPGDACGACGALACDGLDALACQGDAMNECGGCAALTGTPGAACGTCGDGTLRCDGADAVACEGDVVNACGGCTTLTEAPGNGCGACGMGTLACASAEELACEGDVGNACGGCTTLAESPGEVCGACGTATWRCDGADALACDETFNDCGGCAALAGVPGEACGSRCGAWACDGMETLLCDESSGCPDRAACTGSEDCRSRSCSNGRCVPVGFAFIPAGTFTMGAPPDEQGFHPDRENGQHTAILTRSYIAMTTTVTQGDWFALTDTRPAFFANCGDECPVERVDWWETLAYANLLSRSEGLEECYPLTACTGTLGGGCAPGQQTCRGYACTDLVDAALDCDGYRLPTETEWERMARAGTTTAFLTASGTITYWSATPLDPELDRIAWYGGNSQVTYAGGYDCSAFNPAGTCGTHPVALKEPNAWGLFDMSGNVWEKVYDRAAYYPEPGSVVTDYTGPETGTTRRVRGGPFASWAQYMRVAYRTGPGPDFRSFAQGFRLVRTFAVMD